MRWSEFSFLTRLLSALWYFFLDAYRGSMSVARAVRSALSLGTTRNALVLIFTMIPSVLVPRAVGRALVDTTGLWVPVGRLPTQSRGSAWEVVSRSRYLGDQGCCRSSPWLQSEVAGLFQRTHVHHVQRELVSDASPLLGLEGLAAQRAESDAFRGRWCMS